VDADKIEANCKKGVLTVTLPKKPEAIKPERKIEIKAGGFLSRRSGKTAGLHTCCATGQRLCVTIG
jgi:hypothetical protein